ncbi:MAG TPA: hypothetical protein DD979_02840 [Gammaproteobacteria bacterium]|nr:hypothetical protein [Gammaproteobacteria bacterium]
MKLRTQLLLAVAFTLLLPVASWHYFVQLHDVLRASQRDTLALRLSSVATVLPHLPDHALLSASSTSANDMYADTVAHAIALDGYAEDWSSLSRPPRELSPSASGTEAIEPVVAARVAVSPTHVYLYLAVTDDMLVWHDPVSGLAASGDRVMVYLQEEDGALREFVVRAIAPGKLQGFERVYYKPQKQGLMPASQIEAFWEPRATGYSVELSLPRPENGAGFGFSVVDVDANAAELTRTGTFDPTQSTQVPRLWYASQALQTALEPMVPPGARMRVFSPDGWTVADVDRLGELPRSEQVIDPRTAGLVDALLYRLFHWMRVQSGEVVDVVVVEQEDAMRQRASLERAASEASSRLYRSSGVLVTADVQPLVGDTPGYLLLEMADETTGAIVSSTLVRMFGAFVLTTALLVAGLLVYATRLSWRIRTIGSAATLAYQGDGEIRTDIPGCGAGDEVGELARTIRTLLRALASYTDYLQKLASRLSHEMRTPLAVISTSLESVDRQHLSEADKAFVERAAKASARLQSLVRSMSEATRLEQAVQATEYEPLDVRDWLPIATAMYRDIYPHADIVFHARANQKATQPVVVKGASDLLQLMLDKVIANAVDFTPSDGVIRIELACLDDQAEIRVSNPGPPLPDIGAQAVFDPMVSRRPEGGTDGHLGLGLHLVKLVVKAHGGRVKASNQDQGSGVVITIRLPLARRSHA